MTISTTAAIHPAVLALAAALPASAVRPPVLLTTDRQVSRRSQGRTDAQPAGVVASVGASRDGARPAGWGISTAGRKVRDQATEEWMVTYAIRAPQTEAECAAVAGGVSARWIAEGERVLGLGLSDGGDARDTVTHDGRTQSLRDLVAAARAAA